MHRNSCGRLSSHWSRAWRSAGSFVVTPMCRVMLLTVLVRSLAAGAALAQSVAAPGQVPNAEAIAPAWSAPEPWRTDRFYLETSLYATHFHYDPAHNDRLRLILGEWNVTEHWLVGASAFDNSFGQRSQYFYGGFRLRPFASVQPLYLKVSAGLVHGYKNPYRDKIPLNGSGVAPAAIASIGYCVNRVCSELIVFGAAGLLVTIGVTVP